MKHPGKRLLITMMGLVATVVIAQQPNPDQAFYMQAAEGGMAEVEAGKLAQAKGNSAAVKDFGSQMVADHGKANAKLKSIAANKQVMLPSAPSAEHQTMKKKLEGLTGAAFDAAYVQGQVADHEKVAALLEKEIASGKDADAKAFAMETLPTVKAHLAMAQKLAHGGMDATKHE
jgi:putative membrane protein